MAKQLDKDLVSQLENAMATIARVIEALRGPAVEVSADVADRVARLSRAGKCLLCGESLDGEERVKRGLHARCYLTARTAIVRGETTEAQLIAEGRLGPPGKAGRRRRELPDLSELDAIAKSTADLPNESIVDGAVRAARELSQATKKAKKTQH